VDRVAADGTGRGLTVGGSPDEVAVYLDGYRRLGVGEVIFVFRHPFDFKTIDRVGDVRAALGS
jgi:alkanesulfonate monooxygenase SsuD/methylene tetrahydromethanopterin reductase-like flavin-dependent oxidoreductase (luciferase family)